jgi:hypothetical protein
MGLVALNDLMVVCLPFDQRFAGSNPAEDDRSLRAIKIRHTASFRGEVKLSLQSLKILQHVKDPYEYENDTSKAKFSDQFCKVSPASLLDVSAGNCQTTLVDESEVTREIEWGSTIAYKLRWHKGRLVRQPQ